MPFASRRSTTRTASPSLPTETLVLRDGRECVVRRGVAADARAVRAIIDEVAAEPDVPLLATPGSIGLADVKALIARATRDSQSLFLVAEIAGRPAGNLGASALGFEPSAHVVEVGMSVGAAYRGVGVGSALLEAALAWAADAGFAKVTLSAFPHNARAISFYQRHGFTVEGRRVGQYRREGRTYDELVMGRLLGPDGARPSPGGGGEA